MNQVAEYIKYRRKAKKRHGIHSPFVFELSDHVLTTPMTSHDKSTLAKIKESFIRNKQKIQIQDLGAGSKKLSNQRRVCDIYRTSSSGTKYGTLLYAIVKYYNINHVLELGTSLGVGTSHMAVANPHVIIETVEGCPATANQASDMFAKNDFNNIKVHQSSFKEYIADLNEESFDLIYIDGHHDGQALAEYIELLKPYSHDMTIWILDDIRWSDSMYDTWQELTNSVYFHVSIDLFRMGILLKKTDQHKEHFTLRF